ncbi:MAG: hypothetical protein IT536_21175 [Hyphomicrobiales bacterium]|nr:hypothetical protein [Hyphomicrobiales bacterium]
MIRHIATVLFAAAIALSPVAVISADAQTSAPQKQKKSTTKRVAAKKAVPVSLDPPRARITVQRRSFLDAGTHVIPGDRKFTDYALPPGYSPTAVIENRAGVFRSPLPGPYDLPGRDNPWPWHYCVGC